MIYRADAPGLIRTGVRWLGLLSLGWMYSGLTRKRPQSLLDNSPMQALLARSFELAAAEQRHAGGVAHGRALGLERVEKPAATGAPLPREKLEKEIWNQLRSCYDPAIPVNIFDLGLIYDCHIEPLNPGSHRVDVKMTLTAPGCGMGTFIANDARQKILELDEVTDAQVDLVWDPPWNPSMMSEEARLKLGIG